MKNPKAAIVWNDPNTKKVATHSLLNGTHLKAARKLSRRRRWFSFRFFRLSSSRLSASFVDGLFTKIAGTRARAIHPSPTQIERLRTPAAADS